MNDKTSQICQDQYTVRKMGKIYLSLNFLIPKDIFLVVYLPATLPYQDVVDTTCFLVC